MVCSTATTAIMNLRFLDLDNEPLKMLLPIEDYRNFALISLEKANIAKILPDGLTQDESAAIQLYTLEWYPSDRSLYYQLNQTLRLEDRQQMIPWFSYLKLFLAALFKLPNVKATVWRGVKSDLTSQYPKGRRCTWWGLSSCTESTEVLKQPQFLGTTGTLFSIECLNSKNIKQHSYFQTESEILLMSATYLEVVSQLNGGADGLHIIHLKEIKPPHPLLQSPFCARQTTIQSQNIINKSVKLPTWNQ
ncbi:unnamed protein product [Didymodactylos carnosus]|uniref:NAD(P)(+)--arginine ADP-ribosyltransferase n=1 Tax=Didymodactylos carnosus TaxID=1234261 RepID=A0A815HEX6_9BILA|nr:unnamed protein product [Didymodactylos carnosus]CAF1351260.1 unnamed protein product [Didymodactylos carnosus]CAF3755126.1 unnamed protein product [Didymodactylos carnosus]CAF4221428.1 unnamed protein product [Didymodactylos carnosus]